MRAAAYTRVSSQEQTAGTSMDVQREQTTSYAALKGMELVGVYSDPGMSGSVPLAQRPSGAQLCELIEAGEIDCIILTKLDRGFRSTSDCLNMVELWEKRGVALHIIDLGGNSVDTKSPAGKFMLSVLAAAAEMERGMIRERCKIGRAARKKEGKRIGEIPFGWTLAEDNRTLVEDATEQKALKAMKELRAAGESLRAIAWWLTAKNISTKRGGAWTHGHVASILKRKAA